LAFYFLLLISKEYSNLFCFLHIVQLFSNRDSFVVRLRSSGSSLTQEKTGSLD
jgi:hypothetical protein